jgi:hypothetical protein
MFDGGFSFVWPRDIHAISGVGYALRASSAWQLQWETKMGSKDSLASIVHLAFAIEICLDPTQIVLHVDLQYRGEGF